MIASGPSERAARRSSSRRAPLLAALVVGAMLLSTAGLAVGAGARTVAPPAATTVTPAAEGSPGSQIICIVCIELAPTWVNVTPTGLNAQPPATFGGAAAWDAADNETVYFGGNFEGGSNAASNATWVFANGTWTNLTNPLAAPPARAYPTMDYDANMGGVLMFGGLGPGGTYLNDTWLFSGGAWTNVSSYSVAPPARAYATMAFDPQPEENGSVLFGGYGVGGYLADTWIWEGGAGWVKLTRSSLAPPAVADQAMAYDAASGYVVEFGGYLDSGAMSSQTWELYSGEWWNVTTKVAPPAEYDGVMTYYPSASGVLLFGGYNYSSDDQNNQTWLFDNGVWSKQAPAQAPPQLDSSGFALAAGGTVPILVDGFNLTKYGGYNETWAYIIAPSVTLAASGADAELGQTVTYTATETFGTPSFRATFTFGDGSDELVTGGSSTIVATHVFTEPGTYLASVSVDDAVGAVATSSLLEVHITAGPSVRASATPSVADVGAAVAFVTNVTSPGALPMTFAWSFGDGGTASTQNATHTYATAATYDATVTVTDADLVSSTSVVAVVVVAAPSVSAALAPHQPVTGELARFYGNVSGGTGPYSYTWVFGDHSSSSLPDPLHQYNATGTYTVQLWVNDSGGGSSHASMSVTVRTSSAAGFVAGAPLWFWGGIAGLAAAGVVGSLVLLMRGRPPKP